MALHGQGQILGAHAAAVIGDVDALDTAAIDQGDDAAGTGIQPTKPSVTGSFQQDCTSWLTPFASSTGSDFAFDPLV